MESDVDGRVSERGVDRVAARRAGRGHPGASPIPRTLLEEREAARAAAAPTFDIPMVMNDKVMAFCRLLREPTARDAFQAGLDRSRQYLPLFRRVYEEAGLPLDLIYMAHVESGYKTTAYSRARARGIFQFMAPTARLYGLKIDYWVDERLDPEKSRAGLGGLLEQTLRRLWRLAPGASGVQRRRGQGAPRSRAQRRARLLGTTLLTGPGD